VEHGTLIARGLWSSEEAEQSSIWRELRAVQLVLESFRENLDPLVQTDHTVWQSKTPFPSRSSEYFSACAHNHIQIEHEWINREHNELGIITAKWLIGTIGY